MDYYVKSNLFGLYNNFICNVLRTRMNKFPLNFAFEGALYKAWCVTKKNYLGQKIENETCTLLPNG